MIGLSDTAFRYWIIGLCYAGDMLTDGWIPRHVIGRSTRASAELTKAGLWIPADDHTGWWIHDYLAYQSSRADVLRTTVARRKAGKQGGRPPKANL